MAYLNCQVRILFNIFGDHSNTNAQSLNAREIALRLSPNRYSCTFFLSDEPDPRLLGRSNISFVRIPRRKGLFFALLHQMTTSYDIAVYPPFFKTVPFWKRFASAKKWTLIAPIEGPIGYLKEEDLHRYRHMCAAYKRHHFLVPISDYVKEEFSHESGLPTVEPIPVGINSSFFEPRSERLTNKSPRVLFVGRMIKRKGPDIVIACAEKFPGITFTLVGTAYEDEDRLFYNNLRLNVKESGLSNVTFTGAVSQERLRELMWESDILLHPSRVEGIPRVTLEAAASGLPCIVFNDYRTPSVVNGVTGFQVARFDEMLTKLKMLLEDKELRLRLGSAALQHSAQFDWDIIVPRWEKLFQKAIAHRQA